MATAFGGGLKGGQLCTLTYTFCPQQGGKRRDEADSPCDSNCVARAAAFPSLADFGLIDGYEFIGARVPACKKILYREWASRPASGAG